MFFLSSVICDLGLILWKNSCSFKDPLLGLSRMCGARGGLGSQAAESLEKEKEEGTATEIWTNSQTSKKKNEFFN